MNPAHTDPCTFVEERLELFLDGELSGSENLAFSTHLKECESCAAWWADEQRLAESLFLALAPSARESAPAGATPRRRRTPRPSAARTVGELTEARWRWRFAGAMAAAAILAATATAIFMDSRRAESQPEANLFEARWIEGGLEVRDADGASWEPLGARRAVVPGLLYRATIGPATLALADRGSVVLGEDGAISFSALPEECGVLAARLESGRLRADLDAIPFRVAAGAAVVQGRSATLSLDLDESSGMPQVSVLRGAVSVATQGETFVVTAGERWAGASSRARETATALAAAARDREILAQLLDAATEEIADLRDRLAEAQTPTPQQPHEPVRDVADTGPARIIERYLGVVDRTNSVDVCRPNDFAREAIAGLAGFGPAVVTVLEETYLREDRSIRRVATLGLLAGVGYDEALPVLERASFDADRRVRRAALALLDRRTDPGLADHFMAVADVEQVASLRVMAAAAAARRDHRDAVPRLCQIYYEDENLHLKALVVTALGRIAKRDARALGFLRALVRDWVATDSPWMLRLAVEALGRLRDEESAVSLQNLLERPGLPDGVRSPIEEALRRITRG